VKIDQKDGLVVAVAHEASVQDRVAHALEPRRPTREPVARLGARQLPVADVELPGEVKNDRHERQTAPRLRLPVPVGSIVG
jgi:hypothetical protein